MNAKQYIALTAWNLYPLTQDPRIVAFLHANNGSDILQQVMNLLQSCCAGERPGQTAAALADKLIDYTWEKSDDENAEQGALELLDGIERLCADIKMKRMSALPYAEAALNYRLDFLSESMEENHWRDNCQTVLNHARENALKNSTEKNLNRQHQELLTLLQPAEIPAHPDAED